MPDILSGFDLPTCCFLLASKESRLYASAAADAPQTQKCPSMLGSTRVTTVRCFPGRPIFWARASLGLGFFAGDRAEGYEFEGFSDWVRFFVQVA